MFVGLLVLEGGVEMEQKQKTQWAKISRPARLCLAPLVLGYSLFGKTIYSHSLSSWTLSFLARPF